MRNMPQAIAASLLGKSTIIAFLLASGLALAQHTANEALDGGTSPGVPDQSVVGRSFGAVEILTDTQGVDFAPYVARILSDIRANWYASIPESTWMKKGTVVIEFAIKKNGDIAGMKMIDFSGDVTLDRAAWGGITGSKPLPPLPPEFKGEYLALRFHFLYNPDAAHFLSTNPTPLNTPGPSVPFMPAVLMAHTAEWMAPRYSKEARKAKVEGVVRLDAEIGTDGKVKDFKIIEGDSMLADASSHAIRKWRFYSAQKDGKPVGDEARIEVDFHLEGARVQAQVLSYTDPSRKSAP
jgi:TonB family protein